MKRKILRSLFVVAATALVWSACDRKAATAPAYTSPMSTDDIADAVTVGITANSNGIAQEAMAINSYLAGMGVYTQYPYLPCNGTKDTTFARTASAASVYYKYNGDWDCLLSCVNGSPDSIRMIQNMNGNFSHANLSGTDGSSATLNISGLQAASPTITINGTYTRTGTDTSKVRTNNTYSSIVTYTLTNVVVDKTSQQIIGGNGTFTITGYSKGVAYQDAGVITFSKTNSASLTFDGTAYNIVMY